MGLVTSHPFDLAYRAAEAFTDALRQRSKAAGFMKTLLLQRICSSFASGRATAEKMRRREQLDDEEAPRQMEGIVEQVTPEEARHLDTIVEELSRPEARDPKTAAVTYFLTEHRSEGKTWLDHGCIIFSQYYDTVRALAAALACGAAGRSRRHLRRRGQERRPPGWRLRLGGTRGDQGRHTSGMKSAFSSRPMPRARDSTCKP